MEEQKLKKILLKENYISQEDLKKAETESKKTGIALEEYLIRESLITKDIIGQAVAEYYKVPYFNLSVKAPSPEIMTLIPLNIAQKNNFIPVEKEGDEIVIATDNPDNPYLGQMLREVLSGKKTRVVYSLKEDIKDVLFQNKKDYKKDDLESSLKEPRNIFDQILTSAFSNHASDIHFEPREGKTIVRMRIDGVLRETGEFSQEKYRGILNLVKVMAGLKTDIHFEPQDGAIRYIKEKNKTDLRVSIAPAIDGEKVVIRILAEYIHSFALSDLGLSKENQKMIEEAVAKPFGMILAAGPTGSGKTTTLYSLLIKLNEPGINIVTIEDPVEYKISGINHIQVNPYIQLTFAKGLRTIVRQDPDVILVGEIRDKETANISVNAALTGHLLLSSFHANDSATAITRLLDMGIEPFSLASTIELIVSQRLVRKICEGCKESYEISPSEIKELQNAEKYFGNKKITLYHGKGCNACNGTGFKGRIGIFELIHPTPEMKDLIIKNPSAKQIWDLAVKEGAKTLFDDGLEKVKDGQTSLKELLRVAAPLEY